MRQVMRSVDHRKRLLVGYSGYHSRDKIALLRRVRDTFPTDACLDELVRLDVRFVILLPEREARMVPSAARRLPLHCRW